MQTHSRRMKSSGSCYGWRDDSACILFPMHDSVRGPEGDVDLTTWSSFSQQQQRSKGAEAAVSLA